MTLTLGQLVDAEGSLVELLRVSLPAASAFHVAKISRLVRDEAKGYHVQRNALIQRLGVAVSSGTFTVSEANMPSFEKEVNDLRSTVVDMPTTPITMAMLAGSSLTAGTLVGLGPLLVE